MNASSVVKHRVHAFLATVAVLLGSVALSSISSATAGPAIAVHSDEPVEPKASVKSDVGNNPEPSLLVAGGRETTGNKHPWLVQITLNGDQFCHGVLIHPRVVMTTAHCLVEPDGRPRHMSGWVQLFAGRTHWDVGGVELTPIGDLIHPNYDPATSGNDLAFLALESPAPNPTLKVAGAREKALWRPGRVAAFAGFGAYDHHSAPSPALKEFKAPILADSVCGSNKLYGDRYDPATMLCAGNLTGGGNPCRFDQGSPLTVPIDGGGRRVVGLASWGDGCETPDAPTVYTRVTGAGISDGITAAVKEIKRAERFSRALSEIGVVGWGAKPAGCSAAKAKVKKLKKAKGKIKARVVTEKKRIPRASGKLRRAKAALTKAKAKIKSAVRKSGRTCN